MKVKNANHSSQKTRNIIKKTFAEMLSEKKELAKISVSELVRRADINRGTFYSHYDDIYAVAEDYENELISLFFSNAELIASTNTDKFIDLMFEYIKRNDEIYRMLCKSNDFVMIMQKFMRLAANKIIEIINASPEIVEREFITLEVNSFIEGFMFEYVKCCRDASENTIDDLYDFSKYWYGNFIERRKKRASRHVQSVSSSDVTDGK
ncbi:MAG TPA: TetR/AcrR family transcriptional regulator [Firmicutes bacterium]|nr:TetR/AcrR family transcriptional regulator [Bacillota bacterium]